MQIVLEHISDEVLVPMMPTDCLPLLLALSWLAKQHQFLAAADTRCTPSYQAGHIPHISTKRVLCLPLQRLCPGSLMWQAP